MKSYEMNEVMYADPSLFLTYIDLIIRRILTVATIIFLPLTLLTGYFVRIAYLILLHTFTSVIGNELLLHVFCYPAHGSFVSIVCFMLVKC